MVNRSMAYEIIKRLHTKGETDLLLTLKIMLRQNEKLITNFMRYRNYHLTGSIVIANIIYSKN